MDASVEEGDLEGAVADGARLADELVQARFGDCAVALVEYDGLPPYRPVAGWSQLVR